MLVASRRTDLAHGCARVEESQRDAWREGNQATVERAFTRLDVRDAACFNERDKIQILNVIETAFGGLERFNGVVRALISKTSGRRSSVVPAVMAEQSAA